MEPVKAQHAGPPHNASEGHVGATIQMLRRERQLSLRTLAARSGFSPSFISQVEHGQASPSIGSLEKIASALGVTLGEFFARGPAAVDPAPVTIVRALDRPELTSGWSRATLEALGPTGPGHVLEPVLVTLRQGGRSGDRMASPTGQEFAVVWEGEVELTLDGKPHRLATGDAVTYSSAMWNRWENLGPALARILIVVARLSSWPPAP